MAGRWQKRRTRAGCKPSALSVARAHFSAAVEAAAGGAAAGGAGSSHHEGRKADSCTEWSITHAPKAQVTQCPPFRALQRPCTALSPVFQAACLPAPDTRSPLSSPFCHPPTACPVPLLVLNLLPEMPSQPKFSPSSNKAVLPLL